MAVINEFSKNKICIICTVTNYFLRPMVGFSQRYQGIGGWGPLGPDLFLDLMGVFPIS